MHFSNDKMADDQTRERFPNMTNRGGMALTAELVSLTLRPEPELGPEPGWTELTDTELDELAARYDAECGNEALWVFAYGSLIWRPDFEAVEHECATAFGWHRSFCLKISRWRGSPSQHGLMLALERGGSCDGVIYRLPDEGRRAQIRRMLFREIRFHHNLDMIRWIPVHTAQGKVRAMVFWAGPKGQHVVSDMTTDQVASVLARACGPLGSCAEYLYNTVLHLRDFGIHDRNLWALQERVAAEIRSLNGNSP